MKTFALLVMAAGILTAQSFEAASVRRSAPEAVGKARSTGAVPRQQEPGRINYPNVNLKAVLALAYGVDRDQVAGPQWLDDERYDIVATLPADATQEQVPAMLQHLLSDRFRMSVHMETRQRARLALVVGKNMPKLTPAKESSRFGFEANSDNVVFTKATMTSLARMLTLFVGRPVADETGITGEYDIKVNTTWAELQLGSVGAILDLGFRLEPRSSPAKFVVVTQADKVPTDN